VSLREKLRNTVNPEVVMYQPEMIAWSTASAWTVTMCSENAPSTKN
jgi:hypothetical protein